MSKIKINGIMQNAGLVAIEVRSVPSRPCTAGQIMKALGTKEINVQFIIQCIDAKNNDHVVFCIDKDDTNPTLAILEEIRLEMGNGEIVKHPNIALISVFGPDFRQRPGIAGTMFSALGERCINILAISTSISTLSCVIDTAQLDEAIQALHETFDLP